MEWPSTNIKRGGILQPAKANYCPETHQFLKLLMEEAKMSMTQRRKLNEIIDAGASLPPLNSSRSESSLIKPTRRPPRILIGSGISRRRPLNVIEASGAYTREKFVPKLKIDRDEEKQRLQQKMAYGGDIVKVKKQKIVSDKVVAIRPELCRFEQIMGEIEERENWLREMKEIGEHQKYELMIQLEVEARMRELEKLSLEHK